MSKEKHSNKQKKNVLQIKRDKRKKQSKIRGSGKKVTKRF